MSSAPPIQILVVDDEPTLRLGFTFALESEGYAVSTACDGNEALEKIEGADGAFDAMVLDLRMPGKDGLTVLKELAASDQSIPTVVASAWVDSPTAVEAVQAGTVDFLRKPATPDELRSVVARILAEQVLPAESEPVDDTLDAAVSAARSSARRRDFATAQSILLEAKERASARGEEFIGEAKLWLLLASHFLHLQEMSESASELQSSNFYQAADLLDFLAYNG